MQAELYPMNGGSSACLATDGDEMQKGGNTAKGCRRKDVVRCSDREL